MELHICQWNEEITSSAFAVGPNVEDELPLKVDLTTRLHKREISNTGLVLRRRLESACSEKGCRSVSVSSRHLSSPFQQSKL